MWEVCGCQSRACGDDSVKHLRVRSLPCRNPSSSFAACADFLLLILNSCRFSCLNTVVYASCCASGYGVRLMFSSWFILQSAAKIFIIAVVKKPNDCSLCDWLMLLLYTAPSKVQYCTLIKDENASAYNAYKSLHKWTKTISFWAANTEIQLCRATTLPMMGFFFHKEKKKKPPKKSSKLYSDIQTPVVTVVTARHC